MTVSEPGLRISDCCTSVVVVEEFHLLVSIKGFSEASGFDRDLNFGWSKDIASHKQSFKPGKSLF